MVGRLGAFLRHLVAKNWVGNQKQDKMIFLRFLVPNVWVKVSFGLLCAKLKWDPKLLFLAIPGLFWSFCELLSERRWKLFQ